MSNKIKSSFFLEMISIVFAVLLALALDSWRENYKEEQKTQKALTDIFNEIQHMKVATGYTSYNDSILTSLEKDIAKYDNGEPVRFNLGFARPELRNLAWLSAKESGATINMPTGLFQDFSEIYIEFDRLERILQFNRDFSLTLDPETPEYKVAKLLREQLSRVLFRCKELNRKTADLLEKYKDSEFLAET